LEKLIVIRTFSIFNSQFSTFNYPGIPGLKARANVYATKKLPQTIILWHELLSIKNTSSI